MQLDTTMYRVDNFRGWLRRASGLPCVCVSCGNRCEVTMNEQAQPAGSDPLFNPLSPDFIRDPYPHYDRLRTIDPIHVSPFGQFVASRHAEVSLVMRDKRFGKDFVERSKRRYSPAIMDE